MPSHRLIAAALLCAFSLVVTAQASAAPAEQLPPSAIEPPATTEPPAESGAPEETAPEQAVPQKIPGEQSGELAMPPDEAPPLETPPRPSEMPRTELRVPVKGMTMDEVAAQFGEPREKLPAVGKPPITRWIYADYTVYFEYKEVIHSVLNEPPPAP